MLNDYIGQQIVRACRFAEEFWAAAVRAEVTTRDVIGLPCRSLPRSITSTENLKLAPMSGSRIPDTVAVDDVASALATISISVSVGAFRDECPSFRPDGPVPIRHLLHNRRGNVPAPNQNQPQQCSLEGIRRCSRVTHPVAWFPRVSFNSLTLSKPVESSDTRDVKVFGGAPKPRWATAER